MIFWFEGGEVDEYVMGNGFVCFDFMCLVGWIVVCVL